MEYTSLIVPDNAADFWCLDQSGAADSGSYVFSTGGIVHTSSGLQWRALQLKEKMANHNGRWAMRCNVQMNGAQNDNAFMMAGTASDFTWCGGSGPSSSLAADPGPWRRQFIGFQYTGGAWKLTGTPQLGSIAIFTYAASFDPVAAPVEWWVVMENNVLSTFIDPTFDDDGILTSGIGASMPIGYVENGRGHNAVAIMHGTNSVCDWTMTDLEFFTGPEYELAAP